MTTKEKLKREIDQLNDDLIEDIYRIINDLKRKKTKKREIHTYKLGGIFDDLNIRQEAYE
jgi:hypothetical protein